MQIGEILIYRDKPYVLVGIDPMSVVGRRVELEDSSTGEHISVLFGELERDVAGGRLTPFQPRLAKEPLS